MNKQEYKKLSQALRTNDYLDVVCPNNFWSVINLGVTATPKIYELVLNNIIESRGDRYELEIIVLGYSRLCLIRK